MFILIESFFVVLGKLVHGYPQHATGTIRPLSSLA